LAAGIELAYSTYLGGDSLDFANAIAVDASGAAYVAGQTDSTDFNTVGQVEDNETSTDAFISKLTPAGSALAYSTYLGGDNIDRARAIAVDSSGAAYVAGDTDSTDFNTVGPIETDGTGTDAFISKLTAAGSALTYSTYLGGDSQDFGQAVAVDSSGAAYVAGGTLSTDFNTVGPIEGNGTGADAFISKLTAAGSALAYSTYLGGDSSDFALAIAVDSSGAAYVAGETDSTDFTTVGPIEGNGAVKDAFVSKLTAAGSALAYSTYLGGNSTDIANAIAVDSSGAGYVAGRTDSTDFNTVGLIEADGTGTDAYVSKLTAAGSALAYSTYLGGDGGDYANGIAVDSSGAAYVAGQTFSTNFNTMGPIETDGTVDDAFVSKLAVPAPTIIDTDPDSPANDNTVLVKGGASFAATVRVYDSATCAGAPLAIGTAAQFASPGLAVTVPDNSTTALRATDTDTNSLVSACSAAFAYTEDSAQPNSTIARVVVKSRRRKATVTFSGTDAASSPSELDFECKLDGGPFAACDSPQTYRKLKLGRHTVKVRATDEAGNLETSVTTRSFRVRRP
jgi:lipopolysaccharide export system protein LptC